MGVPPQSLAMIKATIALFLTDTAIILRNTPNPNDFYPDDNFAAVGTVDCRILPLSRTSRAEDIIAMQEKGRTYYRLIMPDTADILDGDKVTVNSTTYDVLQIDTKRTDKVDKQAIIAVQGNG